MNKFILVSIVALFSLSSFAHRTDTSTTMLVEKENGSWVLQISASLTAFQQEIQTHFYETPYKTPEEFQQMVLEHVKNNLQISFNESDITLGKGVVKLGHETKVVFEVFGISSDIQIAKVMNSTFKDVHRNQNTLLLFKDGFTKERFVLNNDNNHFINLLVKGNQFVELSESKASLISSNTAIFIGLAIVLSLSIFGISRLFKPEKIELTSITSPNK